MNGAPTVPRVAICVAVLLASLSLVAWRQGRAITVMTEVQQLHSEIELTNADNDDLRQRIQYLESWGRVFVEARDRLGMHIPDASEMANPRGIF